MMDNEDEDANEAISITKPSHKEATSITTSNQNKVNYDNTDINNEIFTTGPMNLLSKHGNNTENTARWTDTESKKVEVTLTGKPSGVTTEHQTALHSKEKSDQKRTAPDNNKTKTKSYNSSISTRNSYEVQAQMQSKNIEKDR
jgi:hypothetical protein